MRSVLSILLTVSCLLAPAAIAGEGDGVFVDHATETEFLPTSAGVMGGAAGAFELPAAWAMNDRSGTAFWYDDRDDTGSALENWGLSMGRSFGLAVQHRTYLTTGDPLGVTDWQLGLAGGDRRSARSLAYRFSTGDGDAIGREKALVASSLHRFGRGVSMGMSYSQSLESAAREGLVDLGVRPFGAPWLTLFGDYALRDGHDWDGGRWSAGAAIRPVPGIQLGVRLRDTWDDDVRATYSIGVTLGGTAGFMTQSYDAAGERMYTTYLTEWDGPRAPVTGGPIIEIGASAARIVPINLENRALTYQRYKWFDETRVAWLDLARVLDAVAADDDVDGVALNLAGFRGRPSLMWELRDALAALRAEGKQVYVHFDRAGMLLYSLASVADHVSMDPEGEIMLPGVDLSRTYMKDMLSKMGLGFEALQYFEHKTAVEALSLDHMSDADREQRGRIVDVIYETVRGAVTDGRGLSDAEFDRIVDEDPLMSADECLAADLVDRLARWNDMGEWLTTDRNAAFGSLTPGWNRRYHDERWGTPPAVAVVYALGECAMDTGIRGRATSAHMRRLVDDPDVKAVVLRADSPGGDPLPSDLVAEAITMLRDAGKPVIVSQGDVAASGGYWISMNATEILTTPLTITGSIGVISGWLWDEELHEKVGVNADGVSRGAHADLFRNVRYPVGFAVPARAMTEEESAYTKELILDMYDRFVKAVAKGRDLDEDHVRSVGGGRVWMGEDAIGHGLCDGIGGLADAVERARELAGIDGVESTVREYPPRNLFEMPEFGLPLPGLRGLFTAAAPSFLFADAVEPADPGLTLVRSLADWNGRPTALTTPDLLPEEWRRGETP